MNRQVDFWRQLREHARRRRGDFVVVMDMGSEVERLDCVKDLLTLPNTYLMEDEARGKLYLTTLPPRPGRLGNSLGALLDGGNILYHTQSQEQEHPGQHRDQKESFVGTIPPENTASKAAGSTRGHYDSVRKGESRKNHCSRFAEKGFRVSTVPSWDDRMEV